mgnify:CR=1 FL=1
MEISVIVPVYNVEKYLEECLESLINQTFKDMEIICVNDGSTDSSGEILKKYEDRVKVINQENKGLSGARNTGIQIAQGKYIGFVDSDDWIDKNFYERLYKAITETNADIAAASIIRGENKYRVKYFSQNVYTNLADKLTVCGLPKSCYVWNKLYKSELVKSSEFSQGVYYEDVIWIPNILKKANSIVTVPETEYHYRRNSNSIVKSIQSEKKQRDLYNAHEFLADFFEENNVPMSKKYKRITYKIYYLWKIPILKIKSYKEHWEYYLFGLVPIFRKRQ